VRLRLAVLVALVVAPVLLGAACSSSDSEDQALPPNDFDELAEIFDPELRPLGLKLTRGALVDTENDGYRKSDTGGHLALYVEPTRDYSPEDYARGIVPSAQVFLPEVFERWPELETMDVCQEPLPGVDDRQSPPPITQLYVARADSRRFDWDDARLTDVIAAAARGKAGFTFYAAPSLVADPAYAEVSAGD
jgi:hypothetical protein